MRQPQKSRKLFLISGIVLLACIIIAVAAVQLGPYLTPIILGVRPAGSVSSALPPDPAPLTLSGEPLEGVDIVLPPHVVDPLRLPASDGVSITGSSSPAQGTAYLISIEEQELSELIRRELLPAEPFAGRFRDLRVDLESGGLVVYGEFNFGFYWQRIGLLLRQEDRTLRIAGIVSKGTLCTLPEKGPLAELLPQVEASINQGLTNLNFAGPLAGSASLQEIRLHSDRIELLARTSTGGLADSDWHIVAQGVEVRQIDPTIGQSTERLTVVRIDPVNVRFRVRYDAQQPRSLVQWGTDLQPLLVVNGGYFTPENQPLGLLISDGQASGTTYGDFAGMLAVDAAGTVSVRWLRDHPYDPAEPLQQALQSFPILVKPGGEVGFPADADDGQVARRTVVAQDRSGRILFIVASRGFTTLHDLAVFLTESDLDIHIALNLDGGGSTGLWLNGGDTRLVVDSFTPVPAVITVEEK